ncbi:hypothetical protein FOXYSP1_19056 [Fusarium oxysporum f. sp. phaseoli]
MNTDELLRVWWRGCAIFSPNVAEVSSAHCCLILKPAATLKAINHFASRIAHCHCRAEVAIAVRWQDLFPAVECSKEARALV